MKGGAGEGTRTLDTELGKLVLYQLSYARPDPDDDGMISARRRAVKGPRRLHVTPTEAGVHASAWIPASAGMTAGGTRAYPPRITDKTSSRRARMASSEAASRFSLSKGSVFEGRTLKRQSS